MKRFEGPSIKILKLFY